MTGSVRNGVLLAALALAAATGAGPVVAPVAAPAAPAAAACPHGYEATPDTGLDGGPGCRRLVELERPAERFAAIATSLASRAAIPAEQRNAAVREARAMLREALEQRAREGLADFRAPNGAVVAASGNTWKLAGPLPLYADDPQYSPSDLGWTTLSGRITSLAVDPFDSSGNTVYLGSAAGGVWKTTNGGETWLPIGDSLPTLSIGSVTVHPEIPGLVFVGTGEANTNSDAYAGAGVFRSTDGGKTFHEVGQPNSRVPEDVVISRVETAGDYLYVATSTGLYRSDDLGATIAKVALDTGSEAPLANFVTDVRIRPGIENQQEVTAAVGWRSGDIPGEGLYRSTDGGETWAKLNSPTFGAVSESADKIGRVSFTYLQPFGGDEVDNNVMWAIIQDPGKLNNENNPLGIGTPAAVPPTGLNGIYRSGDNGATWELKGNYEVFQDPATNPGSALIGALTPTYGPGIQAWYNQFVAVDPSNPERVLVGLEEVYQTLAKANLPGPAEWSTAGRYWNSCTGLVGDLGTCPPAPIIYGGTTTHPDQHAIAFAETPDGVRAYLGNDGGVYSQEPDPTIGYTSSRWKSLNMTLPLAQPYGAVMSGDSTIWAGLQDNGTIKIAPNGRSDMAFGGDGFDVAVDPADSQVAFSETPNGAMRRTADGGVTWSTITPSGASRQRFNTPFEMDPLDSEHLVYAGGQIFETDSASTVASGGWVNVFDLATDTVANAAATALTVRGDAVYAGWCGSPASAPAGTSACNINTPTGGDFDGALFARGLATNVQSGCARSTGSSDCWHQAAANGLPNRMIHGIAIDPSDPRTVYVALATYSRRWILDRRFFGAGSIFKSTDGGENFVNISGNLPRAVAADIVVAGSRLVVGTDAGVFATASKSDTAWAPMGVGLPPVPAFDLSLNPAGTVLVAATHGRGIWTLPLTAGGPSPDPSPSPTGTTNPRPPKRIPTTGGQVPLWLPLALAPLALLARRRRT